MDNVTCQIIQDLLPLYCDGVCSEESRKLVEAHVRICEKCREELRLMGLPVEAAGPSAEVEAAEAATRAWKKNKRKAFRRGMGITLVLVALAGLLGVGYFLGYHYRTSCADGDWDALRDALSENSQDDTLSGAAVSVQKGNYLAIACRDAKERWHVGIFGPDSVFTNRWVYVGGLDKVRPGKLASWNCRVEGKDTVLVCFGAELPEEITGYTFTNSGVTYICPVEESTVLDFFFVPDAYDTETRLEPIPAP